MKIKNLSIFVLLLLFGCNGEAAETERISILKEESNVAFVEELHILAPKVCMQNNVQDQESIEPFLIDIEVTGELKGLVDEKWNETMDSRNMLQDDESLGKFETNGEPFCTSNNLELNEEITQDEVEKMVTDGGIKVSLTEQDGEVIVTAPLTDFVLGQPDGSVEKP
ncbi:hypothetical protein [Halobacillus seohaensis]|uniref:Lipoprotein n=1 Tax=Halobacillus seohaensis TaxID=447421 RepID=A0ABW2EM64_9BACI